MLACPIREVVCGLQELDSNHFRCVVTRFQKTPFTFRTTTRVHGGITLEGRVYGGVLVGQSTMAASRTVRPTQFMHNLHVNFVDAGELITLHVSSKASKRYFKGSTAEPIEYMIERLRDGLSTATRAVRATQRGRLLLYATISFVGARVRL